MSGVSLLRAASLCAAGYGLLAVSGVIHHFQRTGSLRALVRGLADPWLWAVLVIAALVTFGLWRRQAWGWWLALAAAGFQVFRIVSSYLQSGAFGHMPRPSTLLALALLLAILLLIAPRKARLAANK